MTVLPLDDPRWASLQHAYGSAADVPDLLKALNGVPAPLDGASEPWFSLWSALCHQGDVNTASYASLPHLVADAVRVPAPGRVGHLHLAATIVALGQAERSPAVPKDLQEGFDAAVQRLGELALDGLGAAAALSEEELSVLLGTLAVARGQSSLGNLLLQWTSELECGECGAPTPLSQAYALEH
ncbi:hypothetical protein [Deinococcus sp. QL22]|uniref:hypothetical protein n=1 Tax=Deinococcus sp. QL22 TaxID=2939437 RepID=UPI00201710E8|nr:hypothetical protein [Deinococcus sp. QL22]UQN06541.1 hypothetical protein M1R55_01065 [Deinococcus sp. QL22]